MSTTVDTLRIKVEMDTDQAEAASKRLDKSVDKLAKSTDKTSKSFKTKMGNGVRSATGPAIAALGALAAGGIVAGKAAEEAAVAENRLAQVMSSMGYEGATERVSEYANTLSSQIAAEDESIRATQAKLATFSELTKTADQAGGAFDRATAAAYDMAAAGFGTAEGNAVQLGKALQDPIKGVSALARSGITFSEAEKKKMKALVASGKAGEAQQMILAAIEKQVGGTAAATATSTQKMSIAFGEAQESIGAGLLPVFEKMAGVANSFSTWAQENPKLITAAAVAIGGLSAAILVVRGAMMVWNAVQVVNTAIQWAWNAALAANPIGLIVIAIAALIAGVVLAYKKVGWFRAGVDKLWAGLKVVFGWAVKYIKFVWSVYAKVFGWILNVIKKVIDWVKNNWRKIVPFIIGPVGIAVKWVIQHWDKIRDVFRKVIGGIKNTIGNIVRPFKTAFSKVVGIVKGAINFILRAWNALDFGLHIAVPSWVPKIGGKGFHIDDLIPDIPMLANGGIVTRPTLAMIGEAGPEAVVPLSKGRGYGTTVINNPTFTTNVNGAHDPIRTAGRVADAEETMLRNLAWSVRTA